MYSPCETCKKLYKKKRSSDCVVDCHYAVSLLALSEIKKSLKKTVRSNNADLKSNLVDVMELFGEYCVK